MVRLIVLLALLALAGCGGSSYGTSTSSDDDAGLLLLGGAAFMNGWNQGRGAQPALRTSICQQNAGGLLCTEW